MKPRLVVVFLLIMVLISGLLLRAAYVQILPNEKLKGLQSRQFKTVVELQPRRGVILDRNGFEIASTVAAYSLYADPSLIDSPRVLAKKLSRRLGTAYESIYSKIKDPKKKFVWIQRRMDAVSHDEIQGWNTPGLAFVEEPKRIYPNESLFSNVMGFVGSEGQGLEGLEAKFESDLHGQSKKIALKRDARGRPLVVNGQIFTEAPDGADITLTIDSELQYALEQELASAVKKHRAQSAVGVILDARTSEILAMGSVPNFNPNQPGVGEAIERRNRTVTDPIEPGSTMKTFSLAAALKDGIAAPNTRIFCEDGRFIVNGKKIGESLNHKFGWLTVHEILAHSSNIGTSKVALQSGDARVREMLAKFGFGEKTGVDTLGESRGVLPQLPWRDHLLANISFGHGMSATPLQVANAYAAVANGGELNRPFLVKRIHSKDNETEQDFGPQFIRRVIDQKLASTLTDMLMGVTSQDGTGIKARVNGFPVAGKTGTAQKVGPNGKYINAYVSSFGGFVPANDPKFVIYVAFDDPKDGYYGADVAAPVFAKLAGQALRSSGIQPVLLSEENLLKKEPALESPSQGSESWKGISLREALNRLRGESAPIEIRGRGRLKALSRSPDKIRIDLE